MYVIFCVLTVVTFRIYVFCAFMHVFVCFLLSIVVICSLGQCRIAGHRIYTCFRIFVGNPVLAEAFCIDFLQLFYAVLKWSFLNFFFLIYIFCGWVLYFLNIFILIFDVVNNTLIIVWFFVIYFCYCPCFIVSCSSWFTLIAKLWACGSSKFKTSLVVSCLRKLFFLLLVLVYFSIYI